MKQPCFLLFAALTLLISRSVLFAFPGDHHLPYVVVVETTRDSGAGSLRAAIESANRNAATRIIFQIPTADGGFDTTKKIWRIMPLSPLPPLQKPDTRIEGSGTVMISGDKARKHWSGLRVEAARCRIIGVKWINWPHEIVSIRSSETRIERNEFQSAPYGIVVHGHKSRRNGFEQNLFDGVNSPISLQDGSNDGLAAPSLSIVRDDAIAPVSHKFMVKFKGKAKTNVTLELAYSSDEAWDAPQIRSIRNTHTVKTDAKGSAEWQFDWKGYPVGSWAATATQNGSTSGFSNTVVMPYL